VIGVVGENRLPRVSALRNMMRNVRHNHAWESGHSEKLSGRNRVAAEGSLIILQERRYHSQNGHRNRGTSRLSPDFVFGVFLMLVPAVFGQQANSTQPVIVQPGAPGEPSKTLPPSTRAILPPRSAADVEFMQGMILHHSQAVEMTAMIESHTQNKDLRALGARISSSQSDEIKFMKRWLAARGESIPNTMSNTAAMDMPEMDMPGDGMALMPGMLTAQQMEALRNAKGAEFDRLFLSGMIQHHNGALTMVKNLFNTAGTGQDAELFDFATDADNTQRAEIRIMETMLKKQTTEGKQKQ
jgi:uncharacterized protein (DUF305 family)